MDKEKRKALLTRVLIAVLCVALAVCSVVIVRLAASQKQSPPPPGYGVDGKPGEGEVEKNSGSISAPGFEMLELAADTAPQGFAFSNPAQNNCYMKISLVLQDGTVLWTSKPTAPGAATDEVVLAKPLAPGRYDGAKLCYDCFGDEGCTQPLNNIVIDLYLRASAQK